MAFANPLHEGKDIWNSMEVVMMESIKSLHWALAALELAFVLASTSAAQQQRDPAKDAPDTERRAAQADRPAEVTARKAVAPEQRTQSTDATIATCLAIGNGEEVAAAKLALENAKSEKVKEFAQTMVDDHMKMLQELERFGGHHGLNQQTARAGNGGRDQPQLTRQGQGGFDFLTVKRQIAQQCLASARKCWDEKKTPDAEMAFVGSQIVAHQHMIDASHVLSQYASPELQDLIDKGIETAETHKKHAEKLIEELSHEGHGDTAKN
jgi:predicted outer membrane protein